MADVNRSTEGQDRDRAQRRDVASTPDRMPGREAGTQDDLGARPRQGAGTQRETREASPSRSGSADDDTITFVPDTGSE
ncbi:MAG TPA: hypothetical protein VFQ38_11755 [Longimicrobiales bacterium]|nr:hypothetical protein [Longimicrobiales bacterium]